MEKQDLKVLRDKLRKLQHNQWDQMLKEGRKDEVLLALIQDTYRHCNEVDNMAIELIHQLISKFDELNNYVNVIANRLTELEKLKMRWEEVNHPPTQEEIKAEQLNQWFDHKTDDLPDLEPTNNA